MQLAGLAAAPTCQPAQLLERLVHAVAVPAALLLQLHAHEIAALALLIPGAVPIGALTFAVKALKRAEVCAGA